MHPDDDPLWYDRAEAGEPPGSLLTTLAWLFAAMQSVWGGVGRARALLVRSVSAVLSAQHR